MMSYHWQEVQTAAEEAEVSRQGIAELTNGVQVFVKLDVDETSSKHNEKEVEVHNYLREHQYPHLPRLLTYTGGGVAHATEALTQNNGWEWSTEWHEPKLAAAIHAMLDLGEVAVSYTARDMFAVKMRAQREGGWWLFANSPEHRVQILEMLEQNGYDDEAKALNFTQRALKSTEFNTWESLAHHYVRPHNVAWNPQTEQVKLVGWQHTYTGSPTLEINATLVDAYASGLDVTTKPFAEHLYSPALHRLASFWLRAAILSPHPPASKDMRVNQLHSAMNAIHLADKLQ